MDRRFSLSELLSFALVALTIEFDNEFELQIPHATTRYGTTAGARQAPWLISMVMYQNCLQHLPERGITLRELVRRARTTTNLDGMQRWGYIIAVPNLAPPLPRRTRSRPRPDWFLLPTQAGRLAQQICEPLFAVIESRWQTRFGKAAAASLRHALAGLVAQLAPSLPDCMPILGYGLAVKPMLLDQPREVQPDSTAIPDLPLPALLARVLLAFALEFESESEISLAIAANVLRFAAQPLLARDLPRLSGASKEAIAVATGFLSRHGFATVAPASPGSRNKVLVLTPKGVAAREHWFNLVSTIESRWRSGFGNDAIEDLRRSLYQLVAGSPDELLPLMGGIRPRPENWRSRVPTPKNLPHFPLTLHRGGFPDGS